MNLKKKTIILTGARRIGKSVAEALAKNGANLSIAYNSSKEEADKLVGQAQDLGVKAIAYNADLSEQTDIERLVDETLKSFGQIDGFVHMASPYPKTPLGEISMDDFEKTMKAIAGSAILIGQKVGQVMMKNVGDDVVVDGETVGKIKGKMIFFSDWSVLTRPYKDFAVYNAAKAAIDSITKTLALALAPDITVNAVAPGPILKPSDLSEEENKEALSNTPLAHWGGAEEIAKAVLYLLDADFVTGVVLPVDGGRTIF